MIGIPKICTSVKITQPNLQKIIKVGPLNDRN